MNTLRIGLLAFVVRDLNWLSTAGPASSARADDDWEDRWEDYREELEDRREESRERAKERWERAREREKKRGREPESGKRTVGKRNRSGWTNSMRIEWLCAGRGGIDLGDIMITRRRPAIECIIVYRWWEHTTRMSRARIGTIIVHRIRRRLAITAHPVLDTSRVRTVREKYRPDRFERTGTADGGTATRRTAS